MTIPFLRHDPPDHPDVRPPAPALDAEGPLLRRTRLRLIAWSGGLTLLILVVLGLAVYAAVAGSLRSTSVAQLERRADTLTRYLVDRAQFPGRPPLGPGFGGESANTIAFVVEPNGSVLGATTIEMPTGLPDSTGAQLAERSGSDVRDAVVSGVPVRVYSVAVAASDGTYVVQVVGDRTSEQRLLDTLVSVLLVGGLGAVLLAVFVGYVYAGRALVPIRASIDRRHEALRRQREFTANASHELRTPLTVIKASAADLRRNRDRPVGEVGEALEDIEGEVNHLTALVDDLLLLARTDSGVVEIEQVPLDLADVAAEAVGTITPLAEERGVSIQVDPRPAIVPGDALRLRQLVTILADNAIRHTPAGRSVLVRVRPQAAGAVLEVLDEGPGIREQDLARVFERFWRADDAPPGGTGLGLAIARWIVERHGGTISAANRPEGGARFEVLLPAGGTAHPAVGPDEPVPPAEDGTAAGDTGPTGARAA